MILIQHNWPVGLEYVLDSNPGVSVALSLPEKIVIKAQKIVWLTVRIFVDNAGTGHGCNSKQYFYMGAPSDISKLNLLLTTCLCRLKWRQLANIDFNFFFQTGGFRRLIKREPYFWEGLSPDLKKVFQDKLQLVVIKIIVLKFTCFFKFQNIVKLRIHFNTSWRGTYVHGGL